MERFKIRLEVFEDGEKVFVDKSRKEILKMPINELLEGLRQNKVLPIDVLHAYQVNNIIVLL